MPVTISHPAIAVPLRRFGLILSALFVGSMMPDFEFFLRLSDGRMIAHTFEGLFIFCIPVGMLVLLVFHKLIKFPLLSLLPHEHQVRLYSKVNAFRFLPFRNMLNIIVSLFVGALSHVAWDSLTHYDGWIVQKIPLLSQVLIELPQGSLRVYFALQYLSSIIGVIMLYYWYRCWFLKTKPVENVKMHRFNVKRRIGIALSFFCFAICSGISFGFISHGGFESTQMLKAFIANSSIATASGFMVALTVFGILWHLLIPRNKRVHVTSTSVLDD